MSTRHETTTTLAWMHAGQAHVEAVVDGLDDDALRAPSALPGWTRAHVVGHLARNAEALGRLAAWARTGVETPMYADAEERDRGIEESAARPIAWLRAELVSTAADLAAALAELSDTEWTASVRSAQGRTIPAAEVPWMRTREVWLHAHDIDASLGTDHETPLRLPDGMAEVLLDDITAVMSAREGCPSMLLRSPDGRWRLGRGEPVAVLDGPAGALAGWLTGRSTGGDVASSNGSVPGAPRWL
ncbi:maleylpyruvate isomerase family mycothiol-dependent enzyme [Pseudonocardia sp.]|uniref:maleylpyruvate isomerase family mycothiol-dependent enzyme n=1 Tax=Pseudonocardia sp. TaxID=60912 RepID=UPI003D0A39A3